MKRFVATITLLSFAYFSTACTFSRMTQINSDPAGAKVRIGGIDKGATPTSLKLGCAGITSAGKEIELTKENYRALKTTMEYQTLTSNLVWSILFFWPALFIWGKCPDNSYNFKLDRAVAELEGQSTLTVAELESPYAVFVGGARVVQGQRLVFNPGWHELRAEVDGKLVSAGEVLLETNVDHVVGFGLAKK